MIGIVWVNHHALVRSITAVDRTLLFLNLVLLLFVVLIPFATATVADYLTGKRLGARMSRWRCTAGSSSACRSASASIFEWTLHGQRVYQPLPPRQALASAGAVRRRRPRLRLVAIVVALFNAVAAFVLIALVAVYYIVERTPASAAPPGSADDEETFG